MFRPRDSFCILLLVACHNSICGRATRLGETRQERKTMELYYAQSNFPVASPVQQSSFPVASPEEQQSDFPVLAPQGSPYPSPDICYPPSELVDLGLNCCEPTVCETDDPERHRSLQLTGGGKKICNAEAAAWYKCMKGIDIPLSATGHLGTLTARWKAQRQNEIEKYVCDAAKAGNFPPPLRGWGVGHDVKELTRCDWWIGGFNLQATSITDLGCCPTCGSHNYRVTLEMRDTFEQPFNVKNWKKKDLPWGCKWVVDVLNTEVGTPFDVYHTWTHEFSCDVPCPEPTTSPTINSPSYFPQAAPVQAPSYFPQAAPVQAPEAMQIWYRYDLSPDMPTGMDRTRQHEDSYEYDP